MATYLKYGFTALQLRCTWTNSMQVWLSACNNYSTYCAAGQCASTPGTLGKGTDGILSANTVLPQAAQELCYPLLCDNSPSVTCKPHISRTTKLIQLTSYFKYGFSTEVYLDK